MYHRRQRGFTFMEILVVLVIAGLMLAVVPGFFGNSMQTMRLKQAVRDTVSGLRLARSEAIRNGKSAVFIVDTAERTLEVPQTGKQKTFSDGIDVELTTADSEVVSESRAGFRFFFDGTASGGNIRYSLRNQQYQISVDWLTGRVNAAPAG